MLVYLFDDDEPSKQHKARALLAELNPRDIVLSAQVLGEFYVCVTRKLPRPLAAQDAGDVVLSLGDLEVVGVDAPMVNPFVDRG